MNDCLFPDHVVSGCYMHVSDTKSGIIKKKLSDVLKAKLSRDSDAELDNVFDLSLLSADGFSGNPIWIRDKNPPGWNYYHFEGLSQDYISYEDEIWGADGHVCKAAIWLEIIGNGFFDEFVKRDVYDEMSRDELFERLQDACGYESFSGEDDEDGTDSFNTVLDALYDLKKGKKTPEMEEFLMGLNESLGDSFSLDFLYENLDFFTQSYTYSSCDYPIRTVIIKSKELFEYKVYREKVPEDIRKNVDNAIEILLNPFEYSQIVAYDKVEDRASAIAFLVFGDSSERSSNEDMHPLYTAALEYLIKTLPGLRKEYGDTLNGVSGSFFVLFSCGKLL